MFGNLGIQEILVIAVVVMLIFGSKRIPEFTRELGESAKEFKKGLKDDPKPKAKTDPDSKPEAPPTQTNPPAPSFLTPAATNQPSKPDDAPKEVT
jgi:sec-independent protein translocase protein TatA